MIVILSVAKNLRAKRGTCAPYSINAQGDMDGGM
jgi:hypothetical protein